MALLLRFTRLIDGINERVGKAVYWLVLVAVLVSASNAVVRYVFSVSSNAWLELQWYLFSAIFLLCAGYTLLRNEHVRIDIIVSRLPRRAQIWVDIIGAFFFLLPMAILIMWLAWPMFVESYVRHETSADAGGLLRWPVKVLIPAGFLLLTLQGISELIKRFARLRGLIPDAVQRVHGVQTEHPAGE